MPEPPWTHPVGVSAVLEQWQNSSAVRPLLAAERRLEPRAADFVPLPAELGSALGDALRRLGVQQLYRHQREAILAALAGRHVVVATPTASGKSLCFHLPVLRALQQDPTASALFVYPTKALSRDQEHNIGTLATQAGVASGAIVYDGDTAAEARRSAREKSRIVLTNPDMLHSGILPNHPRWARFFQGLRVVVLDELHTYRGVFGSHMAHVLARLGRVTRFHGSSPTYICATATIGNPEELAARLLAIDPAELCVIRESGAPSAARHLLIVNPPLVNEQVGIRASTLKLAVRLTSDLVRARVPTLVFAPSRNSVEVMLKYLRASVGDVAGNEALMGYRGGYLPDTRRAVERGLRDGQILCVVATNALELGIDIGDLDAVVCAGYPGSIAGTWQRFGRAGRRPAGTSLAVLVCSSSALDQFLARDPEYLLSAGAEQARIDPDNIEILIQHLKCAAFEAPFDLGGTGPRPAHAEPALGERYATLDTEATRQALEYLSGHGLVHQNAGRFYWAGEAFPANNVSLRNIGWDNFVIIDIGTNSSIAELDWRAAHTMLHEQAIYQHDAEQYQVERLDYENHKAFVRKVEPDYFTTALTYRSVNVLDENAVRTLGDAVIGWGEVKVEAKVTGYKKIKFFTHENAGYGDVHLPDMEMHTTSFWLTVPESTIEQLGARGLTRATVIDGLRGLGQALETVGTLALMCEPCDVNRTLGDGVLPGQQGGPPGDAAPGRDFRAGRTGHLNPTIFLFDAHPGGVGLAERMYERAQELLERARRLVAGCTCASGCPACVGPPEQGAGSRHVALELARELLGDSLTAAYPPSGP
ncbi:MAG: DEAD/DEAH box helicase [Polyangiaceae bacterium]|nr:DEAD/DEAH box helicase [Polyangiaceae bacterium]